MTPRPKEVKVGDLVGLRDLYKAHKFLGCDTLHLGVVEGKIVWGHFQRPSSPHLEFVYLHLQIRVWIEERWVLMILIFVLGTERMGLESW